MGRTTTRAAAVKEAAAREKAADKVQRDVNEQAEKEMKLDEGTPQKVSEEQTQGDKEIEESEPAPQRPEEDPPVLNRLKAVDDEFRAIERELDQAVQVLHRRRMEEQAVLLRARAAKLCFGEASKATPAVEGFWLKALKNCPQTKDVIEEWDEPVLEYLKDIRFSPASASKNLESGFTLVFEFVENPFFANSELVKTYSCEMVNKYTDDWDIKSITATEVEWKSGKNVTVAADTKKVKGGGAKKAKQKVKVKEEPRPSFFRFFFQTMDSEGEVPEEVADFWPEDVEQLMGQDLMIGLTLKDSLIPYAVRWYTGEAKLESDDEDEDDEDDEEEDDEEVEDEP